MAIAGPAGGATATAAELMSHTAGTTVHGFNGYDSKDDIPTVLDILDGRPPANSGAVRARRRLLQRFDYSGAEPPCFNTLSKMSPESLLAAM